MLLQMRSRRSLQGTSGVTNLGTLLPGGPQLPPWLCSL